jgi:cysteine synthase A
MRAFGADVHIVHSPGGQITADLIPQMIEVARKLAAEPGTYATDQLNNRDALVGYAGIGRELLEQTDDPIDVFCGGVGVGGMLLGVAQALREGGSTARIVALEPAGSPLLTTGRAGAHHVEGTGIGMVPPLLTPGSYDEVRAIDENLARETSRRLAREEGIFAGTSSGMNVAAALMLAREVGPGKTVATVAVDTGLKYLAGELYAE